MSGRERLSLVLVTGLSGAGKNSILRGLEDLGFETMDNPPLGSLEALVKHAERNLAIGVDARSRGFDAQIVLHMLARLREDPALQAELVYATADDDALLGRYTETRRRHPLAQGGTVADGIALERELTEALRLAADLVIDTSALPLPSLRRLIEQRYADGAPGMAISLISFGFPFGLPREADVVLDARFLRNPHYVPSLRSLTGLDGCVGGYIETDPDFLPFFAHITSMVDFLLPRFVQEGKKYATVAIGCTGGQHRSVYLVERLAAHIGRAGWRVGVTHRELQRGRAGVKKIETGEAAGTIETKGGDRTKQMSGVE
jgi:UPF0042 nucleotide-binding protein